MKRLIIFGSGPFAEIAYTYFSKDSDYEVCAFTVHAQYNAAGTVCGLDVFDFETIEERFPPKEYTMFVAIGFKGVNRARMDVYQQSKAKGYRLASYLCSKAIQWGDIEYGDNCFILENNVIQPFVKIGNNVIIWSGNHIGHHSVIEDNCFIASHAVISGQTTIGRNSFIGVNATLRDGITIAPDCVIGAGALILKNTVEKGVYKADGTPKFKLTSDLLGM